MFSRATEMMLRCFLFAIVFISPPVFAGGTGPEYKIYALDINGDGYDDYLVKEAPKFAMISADDDIPLPILMPASLPPFLLISEVGKYSLNPVVAPGVASLAGWRPDAHSLSFETSDGFASGKLSVVSGTSASTSFVVTRDLATGVLKLTAQSGGLVVPINDAQFTASSVPATMAAGALYPVSLTVRNTGTTTWSAGTVFKLGSRNPADNTTWAVPPDGSRVMVKKDVAPGDAYVAEFTVTAPAPGSYVFQWQMVEENKEWFGAPSAPINVAVVAPSPVVTWTGFNAALTSGSKEQVLAHFQQPDNYRAAITDSEARLAELPGTFVSFNFTEINDKFATAIVSQNFNGEILQHMVSFVYQDGKWLIVDF